MTPLENKPCHLWQGIKIYFGWVQALPNFLRGLTLAYRFIATLFFILFKIFFRFKIIGIEKVPDKGGVIVVSNHVSHLDPLVIGAAIRKRQSTYMAKSELFKMPLIGAFVKTFSFPV
ncbi:1-acyl-sn-glycerol-3-phosphate acyltransferase, partial [Candidatus Hakubella thermalkaliphila]